MCLPFVRTHTPGYLCLTAHEISAQTRVFKVFAGKGSCAEVIKLIDPTVFLTQRFIRYLLDVYVRTAGQDADAKQAGNLAWQFGLHVKQAVNLDVV